MTEKKQKLEEKVLTYREKLEGNISNLEQQFEQAKANVNQIAGALDFAKAMLKEYKESKE